MKKPKHKKRNIVLLFLLAVVCIGGMELIACRHFDPELYQKITAPVRQAATAVAGTCKELYFSAADALNQTIDRASAYLAERWEELTAPPPSAEPNPDTQVADDPALTDHPDISSPLITELIEEDGREILTGGACPVVYFNQKDERWTDQLYGTDDIGTYGCGPTAMAMVVASLTGEETDPVLMSQWAVDHHHWARRSGSYHSIVEGTVENFGLYVQPPIDRTPDALANALLSGNLLVALMGPGHFTQGGHFIVLRGVTLDGGILVADPNSLERSLTVWDPQLILDELSTSTVSGAPLWVIGSEPPTES